MEGAAVGEGVAKSLTHCFTLWPSLYWVSRLGKASFRPRIRTSANWRHRPNPQLVAGSGQKPLQDARIRGEGNFLLKR